MFKKLVKSKNKGLQWAELRMQGPGPWPGGEKGEERLGRQQAPWSLEGRGKESGLYHRCQGSHRRVVSTEVT